MSTDINHKTIYKEDYEYIVAMGISTGGPKLLSQIVQALDESILATYIIVQHMPPGFTKTLAERLNTMTKLTVKEAVNNEVLKKGVVYIAPGGKQLRINNADNPYIVITDEAPYKGHKPSVNVMMNALAQLKECHKKYIAIIMTGMGSDGLEGIMNLKKNKTCTVIAQDAATCTVYGMPRAVIDAGLADYICQGHEITKMIKKIAGDRNGS